MFGETDKIKIRQALQADLTPHRYRHVLGVAAAACRLATRYGYDKDRAEVAGLLHDAAKQIPLTEMQALARASFGNSLGSEIMASGNLLHGYAAVTIARERFGIVDEEVLAALAHHTTGALQMGVLEKIIFLADYIEVNRDFEGVQKLRMLAEKDLDTAVLAGYDSTLQHLITARQHIYVGTVANRNALLQRMQERKRRAEV